MRIFNFTIVIFVLLVSGGLYAAGDCDVKVFPDGSTRCVCPKGEFKFKHDHDALGVDTRTKIEMICFNFGDKPNEQQFEREVNSLLKARVKDITTQKYNDINDYLLLSGTYSDKVYQNTFERQLNLRRRANEPDKIKKSRAIVKCEFRNDRCTCFNFDIGFESTQSNSMNFNNDNTLRDIAKQACENMPKRFSDTRVSDLLDPETTVYNAGEPYKFDLLFQPSLNETLKQVKVEGGGTKNQHPGQLLKERKYFFGLAEAAYKEGQKAFKKGKSDEAIKKYDEAVENYVKGMQKAEWAKKIAKTFNVQSTSLEENGRQVSVTGEADKFLRLGKKNITETKEKIASVMQNDIEKLEKQKRYDEALKKNEELKAFLDINEVYLKSNTALYSKPATNDLRIRGIVKGKEIRRFEQIEKDFKDAYSYHNSGDFRNSVAKYESIINSEACKNASTSVYKKSDLKRYCSEARNSLPKAKLNFARQEKNEKKLRAEAAEKDIEKIAGGNENVDEKTRIQGLFMSASEYNNRDKYPELKEQRKAYVRSIATFNAISTSDYCRENPNDEMCVQAGEEVKLFQERREFSGLYKKAEKTKDEKKRLDSYRQAMLSGVCKVSCTPGDLVCADYGSKCNTATEKVTGNKVVLAPAAEGLMTRVKDLARRLWGRTMVGFGSEPAAGGKDDMPKEKTPQKVSGGSAPAAASKPLTKKQLAKQKCKIQGNHCNCDYYDENNSFHKASNSDDKSHFLVYDNSLGKKVPSVVKASCREAVSTNPRIRYAQNLCNKTEKSYKTIIKDQKAIKSYVELLNYTGDKIANRISINDLIDKIGSKYNTNCVADGKLKKCTCYSYDSGSKNILATNVDTGDNTWNNNVIRACRNSSVEGGFQANFNSFMAPKGKKSKPAGGKAQLLAEKAVAEKSTPPRAPASAPSGGEAAKESKPGLFSKEFWQGALSRVSDGTETGSNETEGVKAATENSEANASTKASVGGKARKGTPTGSRRLPSKEAEEFSKGRARIASSGPDVGHEAGVDATAPTAEAEGTEVQGAAAGPAVSPAGGEEPPAAESESWFGSFFGDYKKGYEQLQQKLSGKSGKLGDVAIDVDTSRYENVTVSPDKIRTCSNSEPVKREYIQLGGAGLDTCWKADEKKCESLYYYDGKLADQKRTNTDTVYEYFYLKYLREDKSLYRSCEWSTEAKKCKPIISCPYYFHSDGDTVMYGISSPETFKDQGRQQEIENNFREEVKYQGMLHAYITKKITGFDSNSEYNITSSLIPLEGSGDEYKWIKCLAQKVTPGDSLSFWVVSLGNLRFVYDDSHKGFIPVEQERIQSVSNFLDSVAVSKTAENLGQSPDQPENTAVCPGDRGRKTAYSAYQLVIHAALRTGLEGDFAVGNHDADNRTEWPGDMKKWQEGMLSCGPTFEQKVMGPLNREEENIKKALASLQGMYAKVADNIKLDDTPVNVKAAVDNVARLAMFYQDSAFLTPFMNTMYYKLFASMNANSAEGAMGTIIPKQYQDRIAEFCKKELCNKEDFIPINSQGYINYPFFAQKVDYTNNVSMPFYNPANSSYGYWIFRNENEVREIFKAQLVHEYTDAILSQAQYVGIVLNRYLADLQGLRKNIGLGGGRIDKKALKAAMKEDEGSSASGGRRSRRGGGRAGGGSTRKWTSDDSWKLGLLMGTGAIKGAEVGFKYKMMKDQLKWEKELANRRVCQDFEELKMMVPWVNADGTTEEISMYDKCMRNMMHLAEGQIRQDHCLEMWNAGLITRKADLRECYGLKAAEILRNPNPLGYTPEVASNSDQQTAARGAAEEPKSDDKKGAAAAGGAPSGGGVSGLSPSSGKDKNTRQRSWPIPTPSYSRSGGGYAPYAGRNNKAPVQAGNSASFDSKVQKSLKDMAAAKGGSLAFDEQLRVHRGLISSSSALQLSRKVPYLNKTDVSTGRRR
ncbi:MAG: hypothetical protein JXA66_01085 [Oligoflexia bacterium]|nr:hypothetical protein [Oligoflexia bacterium]